LQFKKEPPLLKAKSDLLQSLSQAMLAQKILRGYKAKSCICENCNENNFISIVVKVIQKTAYIITKQPHICKIKETIILEVLSEEICTPHCENFRKILNHASLKCILIFTKTLKEKILSKKSKKNSEKLYKHPKLRIIKG
jgi:hypothetical protein